MTVSIGSIRPRVYSFHAGLAAALGLISTASVAADKVIVTGTMLDMQQQAQIQGSIGGTDIDLQTICAAANRLGMYSGMAQVELATQMARAGLDSSVLDLASESLGAALDEVCNRDASEPFTLGPFTIVYASCMMRMESPEGTMAIRITRDGNDAVMEMADHASGQGTQYALLANFTGQAARVTGTGSSDPINMIATGNSREIAGYPAQQHTFDYAMSLGGNGLLEQALGPTAAAGFGSTLAAMSRVTSTGTVWIAPTAPGSDIVTDFYNNLAVILENTQGVGSFMSGTLRSLHGMVKDGLPLEIEQRINAAMGLSSYSWSRVETVTLRPLDPQECDGSTIPEGYVVSDLNEQMSGVPGQPGEQPGGVSAAQQAEAAAAMNQAATAVQEAMNSLTPEQQAAMQQFGGGLGALLGGAGAAIPGMPGAAAPSATSPAATVPAPASARTGASSANLMTDDLNQSVQNMLQALGYDPGNTDGEVSIQTTIAISQFQAEQGLEVTGAVSPQLAGILAAAVDRR